MSHESQKTLAVSAGALSSRLSAEDVSLIVVGGPHQGQELHLEREIVRIGRADWCDLVLSEDHWVSNEHCECWLDEKGIRIRDLGSRNGIVLGGCRLVDAYLAEGAQFKIGGSTIMLKFHHRKREIKIQYKDASGKLVGKSQAMRKIFAMLPRLGERNVPVLLTGETGTGKTSIARAIHLQSCGVSAPFVVVNCGALPAGLIEATLFGHEKGAFTGADKAHAGFFQQANGGTLFLDEIGELPLELQPKLLDVLERRKVRRLGGEKEFEVDFRLITATHRNLHKEMEQGRFREDLYFRISVVEMEVPSLRSRVEDILLLSEALLKELSPNRQLSITPAAMQTMENYLWPGNIRQLRNTLERSITFLDGNILDIEDLILPSYRGEIATQGASTQTALQATPAGSGTKTTSSASNTAEMASHSLLPEDGVHSSVLGGVLPTFPLSAHASPLALKDVLANVEKLLIAQALEETDFNVLDAANMLEISQAWLYNRAKKYNLSTKKKS